jgi:hypothetical protein
MYLGQGTMQRRTRVLLLLSIEYIIYDGIYRKIV